MVDGEQRGWRWQYCSPASTGLSLDSKLSSVWLVIMERRLQVLWTEQCQDQWPVKYRAQYSVPTRTEIWLKIKIMTAIEEKDFQNYADNTIRDSNQFHAICLPRRLVPCVYLFTCTTPGPNACLFLLEKYIIGLVSSLLEHFLVIEVHFLKK